MEKERQYLTYFGDLPNVDNECVNEQAVSATVRNTACLEEVWLFQTLFGKYIPIYLYPVLFLIRKLFPITPLKPVMVLQLPLDNEI